MFEYGLPNYFKWFHGSASNGCTQFIVLHLYYVQLSAVI